MTAKAALNGSRPFRMISGVSRVEDLANGVEALAPNLIGAKTVYYCDGNAGVDTNSGVGGWENAFKTLTVALAASNADVALNKYGWAARNVILCRADSFDEDLVLLAHKTDGVGLGSWDQWQGCGLTGNHVPTGATASYGTRFFNMHFKANAAGGDIWTLDSYAASLGFYGCTFDSRSTTAATAAIVSTAAMNLQIVGCEAWGAFSDAVIEIGAGDAHGLRIIGNVIEGANEGIHINASVTDESGATQRSILIKDNVIRATTTCINDASDIAMIVDNRCVTAAAKGSAGAGAIVGNELFSSGNKISASDLANADWPALGTL